MLVGVARARSSCPFVTLSRFVFSLTSRYVVLRSVPLRLFWGGAGLLRLLRVVTMYLVILQNISTPIITAKLVQDDNKTSARVVKAKIEKTTLGQVTGETC